MAIRGACRCLTRPQTTMPLFGANVISHRAPAPRGQTCTVMMDKLCQKQRSAFRLIQGELRSWERFCIVKFPRSQPQSQAADRSKRLPTVPPTYIRVVISEVASFRVASQNAETPSPAVQVERSHFRVKPHSDALAGKVATCGRYPLDRGLLSVRWRLFAMYGRTPTS
jgi:hypothetical protein